ncbi:hypothetical protein QB607_003076 [Clostridium botulinum]|nr:hypothetical protein [Clostridium botulinum]EKS4395749.1 hypothetical protein [Clostridium botulinum]
MSIETNELKNMLDKPLKDIINENITVYINNSGFNTGILFNKGKFINNTNLIKIESQTECAEIIDISFFSNILETMNLEK